MKLLARLRIPRSTTVLPGKRRGRAWLWAVGSAAVMPGLLWLEGQCVRPDVRRFDPARVGSLESAMWRSYYDRTWPALAWQTLCLARELRYSCWDGARLAWHAGRAAQYFSAETNHPGCRPELERYYRVLAKGTPQGLDERRAAELELRWWQERRRHLRPEEYGRTIAQVGAMVYALPEESVRAAFLLRAEAMAYRDARRGSGMTEADWAEVARRLERAYSLLGEAIATSAR